MGLKRIKLILIQCFSLIYHFLNLSNLRETKTRLAATQVCNTVSNYGTHLQIYRLNTRKLNGYNFKVGKQILKKQKNHTFRKGNVTLLTESHGAIREPQILLGQQEELSVETELHRHWVAHLQAGVKGRWSQRE